MQLGPFCLVFCCRARGGKDNTRKEELDVCFDVKACSVPSVAGGSTCTSYMRTVDEHQEM
jgi:hypothetical protein